MQLINVITTFVILAFASTGTAANAKCAYMTYNMGSFCHSGDSAISYCKGPTKGRCPPKFTGSNDQHTTKKNEEVCAGVPWNTPCQQTLKCC
ncbi:hypothetical protein WAI453_013556 [Rhynchosporium graminicola]